MFQTQLFLPLGVRKVFESVRRNLARPLSPSIPPLKEDERTEIWKDGMTLKLVRHPRARRYLLRLQADGIARLVIPRRGSRREAMAFLERNEAWLCERFRQWKIQENSRGPWEADRTFLFRGGQVILRVEGTELRFGDQVIPARAGDDLRGQVMRHLRALADEELPPRTRELAAIHGIQIRRVTVRAQTTRWGSCSSRGTISLNWRLIQAPPSVRDYLIIHELMHRRQMNHSVRFWKLVAKACPDYRAAETWLKKTRLAEMG